MVSWDHRWAGQVQELQGSTPLPGICPKSTMCEVTCALIHMASWTKLRARLSVHEEGTD